MNRRDKERACLHAARDMLDYIDSCAKRGLVPLRHDANVFRARLNRLGREKLS